jgi:hypothetical protein
MIRGPEHGYLQIVITIMLLGLQEINDKDHIETSNNLQFNC